MPSINLHNIDCLEFMRNVPDKYYDLAIVDPPYGLSDLSKNKYRRHKKVTTYTNKSIPPPEYFQQLQRISKRSIVWGCQYMMEFLSHAGIFIVWDKGADPDLHNMSSCDVAWYSERSRIRKYYLHWCGAVKGEKEATIHIHQKPVGLYRFVLKHYANQGDKIFDSHGGSMSSAIACEEMGFDLDLCEIDKELFDNDLRRVENFRLQQKLELK